ncbi:MAG TPA: hypothetical protein VE083_13380 [Terriglobales bacterium]|nr:hypothetical protein [Terriglobales bacterium]
MYALPATPHWQATYKGFFGSASRVIVAVDSDVLILSSQAANDGGFIDRVMPNAMAKAWPEG